jgi:hypothetical protein
MAFNKKLSDSQRQFVGMHVQRTAPHPGQIECLARVIGVAVRQQSAAGGVFAPNNDSSAFWITRPQFADAVSIKAHNDPEHTKYTLDQLILFPSPFSTQAAALMAQDVQSLLPSSCLSSSCADLSSMKCHARTLHGRDKTELLEHA